MIGNITQPNSKPLKVKNPNTYVMDIKNYTWISRFESENAASVTTETVPKSTYVTTKTEPKSTDIITKIKPNSLQTSSTFTIKITSYYYKKERTINNTYYSWH